MTDLVLSLFPGIGLLDRAFEEEGFCVVRGPDLLWGGDIHEFHPPAGKFDGVIGGPPCQAFSQLRNIAQHPPAPNLIPEFERVVDEARPAWFIMENVTQAPAPVVQDYGITHTDLDNRWLGEPQKRRRSFWFGNKFREGVRLLVETLALENPRYERTVMAGGAYKEGSTSGRLNTMGYTGPRYFRRACEAQGLPDTFDLPPFKQEEKYRAVGNGVPLPMGRAVAKAVKEALK